MSAANVVDSSGWLEYFTDSDRAALFAVAIEDTENLLVPVISSRGFLGSAVRTTRSKSPA